jgi:UDP-N-acetylmuramyl pentapeptide phosphotransferase/UDP-N-acetylglucosamine-1-phosphate transferase
MVPGTPGLRPQTMAILAVAAFVAAWTTTRLVRDFALRRHLLDHPNGRSSHNVPVPRLGGLGVIVAFAIASVAVSTCFPDGSKLAPILLGTVAISALGLVDDLRPLPARVRLAGQVLAALIVVALSDRVRGSPWLELLPWPIVAIFLVLWIVWLTNLYNFMDGIDGLAGGQGVIASVTIAAAAFQSGAALTGSLLVVLAAALAGFLLLNFPPASIFMGDVGSTAVGFFLACVPLLPESRPVPLELVGIALSLFILDATITLLRRIARGERWSEAHRTHYYQRAVAMGQQHRTVSLIAYIGMGLAGTSAVAYQGANPEVRAVFLALPVLVFTLLAAAVHGLERRAARDAGDLGAL